MLESTIELFIQNQ